MADVYKTSEIDLTCFKRMLEDMQGFPRAFRRRVIRTALRRSADLLKREELARTSPFARRTGEVSKWGYRHTGLLRKGIKSYISASDKRGISLFVGVRTKRDKHNPRGEFPATYGGIWLNFGTQAHSVRRGADMSTRKRAYSDGITGGIRVSNWVEGAYDATADKIQDYIAEDCDVALTAALKDYY